MVLSLPNPGDNPWAAALNAALDQLDAQTVVSGTILGDNLVLTKNDGTVQTAGNVRGPAGTSGASDAAVSALVTGSTATRTSLLNLVNPLIATQDASIEARKMEATDWSMEPSQWGAPTGDGLTIPTHVAGTNQVTHPSVLHFPEGWNGYKYWMAYTPYPGSDDDHEDPNLAVSNDGITWVHAPGVTQPLDNQVGVPYNSDPDLVMGPNNTMYLFWRLYDSSLGSNQEKVYVRTSTNGTTWTSRALVWQFTETTLRTLSPSFIYENNRWTAWFIDQQGSTRTFKKMVSTTNSPTGGWGAATTMTIAPIISGKQVWHVSVKRMGNILVGLMNVINPGTGGLGGLIQLITSQDGNTWVASDETVIPQVRGTEHNHLYRASFFPEFRDGVLGLRVYYSAFQETTPATWNIFRTWMGPNGRGKPVTPLAGSGFTLSNVKVYRRPGWVFGTFDWSAGAALTHGQVIAILPGDCTPVTADVAMTLSPGTSPFASVISEAREVISNQPPAGKTSGTIRLKTPILPA